MLYFILKDQKKLALDYYKNHNYLNAKLWTEDGEYIGEINWDINAITDLLFRK